ncbi:unnamed protein product, partial [marine sediment metagenome]
DQTTSQSSPVDEGLELDKYTNQSSYSDSDSEDTESRNDSADMTIRRAYS